MITVLPQDVVVLYKDAEFYRTRSESDAKNKHFFAAKAAMLERAATTCRWVLETQAEAEREASTGS